MDARALALALALPLTARATILIPSKMYPAAPPDAQPVSAGRAVVARACSLGVLSPAREMLRQHLPIGAAAEARGRTLAAEGLGFHADGRYLALAISFPITAGALRSSADGLSIVLSSPVGAPPPATTGCLAAAQDAFSLGVLSPAHELLREHLRLGAATEARGRTLAARDLGFQADGRFLALPIPSTEGALTSIVLGFHPAALPPATTGCLAAAQDLGVQGLQACARRGLSVVCRAYPLVNASPSPTGFHPASAGRRLLLMQIPRTLAPAIQSASDVTDNKKTDEPESNSYLHLALRYLAIALKSKVPFHVAVCGVLAVSRFAVYLWSVLKKCEYISRFSTPVKLPQLVITASAIALLLGKSLYSLLNDTKDVTGLVLYFIDLYMESASVDDKKESETTAAAVTTTSTSDACDSLLASSGYRFKKFKSIS